MASAKRARKTSEKASKGTPLPGRKYYYLHNEGSDKRVILSSQHDFDRFEAYLYLLNALESPRAANLFVGGREKEIFTTARGGNLVAIGAYALLPQSFHILATPLIDGGIGKFMQKLQTAYTMYFNAKYAHSGRLFHSAYRSEQIDSEEKLKQVFARIHIAPAQLFDPNWDVSQGSELATNITRAMNYRYTSINEYCNGMFVITSPQEFPASLKRTKDAQALYAMWTRYKDEK